MSRQLAGLVAERAVARCAGGARVWLLLTAQVAPFGGTSRNKTNQPPRRCGAYGSPVPRRAGKYPLCIFRWCRPMQEDSDGRRGAHTRSNNQCPERTGGRRLTRPTGMIGMFRPTGMADGTGGTDRKSVTRIKRRRLGRGGLPRRRGRGAGTSRSAAASASRWSFRRPRADGTVTTVRSVSIRGTSTAGRRATGRATVGARWPPSASLPGQTASRRSSTAVWRAASSGSTASPPTTVSSP